MIDYPIQIGPGSLVQLRKFLLEKAYTKILVLADENTAEHCYPILQVYLPQHYLCTIPAGETHKNLGTCIYIWQQMTAAALDRNALLLNLGGGVIGDMGGFVAGTYKRGIPFVQIPTTLLSQVDASVGGKLGIDFQGYKNHIGLFREPEGVYIYPDFLQTLSQRELRSGFAEVIKHHLIGDAVGWQQLQTLHHLQQVDFAEMIRHSVEFKARIVAEDPFERGARKALNFGHTIGHAIESHYLDSEAPFLHGEAIAIGMIAESYLSVKRSLLSETERDEIVAFFRRFYPFPPIPVELSTRIFELAQNDKKNQGNEILCTLLQGIGHYSINQALSETDITEAMYFYNEIAGQ